MIKKQFYEAPEAEVLVVRFEENIMSVVNGANYSSVQGGVSGDDEYDDSDSF